MLLLLFRAVFAPPGRPVCPQYVGWGALMVRKPIAGWDSLRLENQIQPERAKEDGGRNPETNCL